MANPHKTFPLALMLAVILVILMYVLPLLACLGVMTDTSDWKLGFFATVARQVGGQWLAWWMLAAAAVSRQDCQHDSPRAHQDCSGLHASLHAEMISMKVSHLLFAILVGKWLFRFGCLQVSQIGQFEAEMSSDSFQLLGMAERGFLPACLARRSRHETPTLAIVLSSVGICALSMFDFQQVGL